MKPQNQAAQEREPQLSSVKRFLHSPCPMMLIIGEAGCGKTRLLNDVVEQNKNSRHILRLRGTTTLQPKQLTDLLSEHWAVKIKDIHARLENQLYEVLLRLAEHDQNCILLVDDAHTLSYSMLAALSHLAMQQENMNVCLHILLSGRPPLGEKITSLHTKKVSQLIIGALDRHTAYTRMKEMLAAADISADAYGTETLAHIYNQAGGMPEIINQHTAMFIAEIKETAKEKKSTAKWPQAVALYWQHPRIKSIALFGFLLSLIFFWHMQHHRAELHQPLPLSFPVLQVRSIQ